VNVPSSIVASADGFLFFDNVGDEAMGQRIVTASGWQRIHLYRQVPESGVIWATAALTGIGMAYVDDIRIEPLVKSTSQFPTIAPAP
jgi:hypothetical protein